MKGFPSLLFQWPEKERPPLLLPFFLFLAFVIHFSTIYLVRISYPVTNIEEPRHAELLFFIPHSEQALALKRWLDGNDPSIFSPLHTVGATRNFLRERRASGSKIIPPLNPLPIPRPAPFKVPIPDISTEILP